VENNRIIALSFEDKRLFLPLQAADILAYELFKRFRVQQGLDDRPIRYPLKQLVTPLQQWHYPDDDELRNVNEWLDRTR
jgi:hypothetical protein